MRPVLLAIFFALGVTDSSYTSRELRCSVCHRIIEEMEKEISKVNPNQKINLGHRINDQGRVVDKTKPFVRSEIHLSELMDSVCEKMENYVRAKHKKTGEFEVIKIMTDSGNMNPILGDYDIIQDSDLNKSLTFHCEGIIEEYDNQIIEVLRHETKDADVKICVETTDICEAAPPHRKIDL